MPRGERDRAKERFWRTRMRQWRRSGQTARDFCAEQGLSEASFYAWRRTIAQRDRQAQPIASPAVFVPVRVTEPTAPNQPAALEVVVGAGRVVRVPAGFDAPTLRQLLVVLEEAPSC
jgi:transposase